MSARLILPIACSFIIGLQFFASPAHSSTLSIAQQYLGMSERNNRAALKRMIGVDPHKTPWCGAFAAYVVRKAGRKPPRSPFIASSWLRYGRAVRPSQARPGDIVVTGRHVGFYHSRSKGKVCLISGNSGNMVRKSCYSAHHIKGVRR